MQEGNADVKLAVLEEKLLNTNDVVAKLDDTIEKMSDLNVSVSKMLAVHEAKIDSVKEESAEQQVEIHSFMKRYDDDIDDISKRLNIIEKRMWMAMGIISAATIVLQSEFIGGIFYDNNQSQQKSVIMRVIQ
jgi:septal ring factor EnvC (AmiA/AmiB activator)